MKRHLEFYGFCNKGYDGQVIRVEADIRSGFPGFDIIGMPDTAIKESRDRIKTALRNCGFKFPQQRVLVSLSPADIPKSGAWLDTAIALAILFNSKNSLDGETVKIMVVGELTLEGLVVQDYSALGAIQAARKAECNICLVPFKVDNTKGIQSIVNLTDAFLKSGEFLADKSVSELEKVQTNKSVKPVFADVIGLEKEKEILTICAAGRHSVLLFGPPGVGKTMVSERIVELLENLTPSQNLEVQHIYGCAGLQKNDKRPTFRWLSHDCSASQFTGGVTQKSPGEGALAHCGVLMLDEITSYSKKLLESVKDTYDRGFTTSSRSGELIKYPASFMIISNMNACPCGKLGEENESCVCSSQKILSHWNKVGSPLLERFDVRLPVEHVDIVSRVGECAKPDSYYRNKIEIACQRQRDRFKNIEGIQFNGQLHISGVDYIHLLSKEINLFCSSFEDKIMSDTRSIISTISIARTIADTEDRDEVSKEDLETALSFKKYGLGDYYWRTIR